MRVARTFAIACALAACRARSRVAAAPDCSAPLKASWSGDSLVAMCLPPDFVEWRSQTWRRMRVGSARAMIWVTTIPAAKDPAEMGAWPPRYSAVTLGCPDCVTAESIVVMSESFDGVKGELQTALMSGGLSGLRRQPDFRAAWIAPAGAHIIVSGFADGVATRDTLIASVRSIRLAYELGTVKLSGAHP